MGKCPKISYIKASDERHMQIVQTQIRLKEKSDLGYTVYHSTKYFKKQLHKKQSFGKKRYGIHCLKF